MAQVARVAVEPASNVVGVDLLAPDESRARLSQHLHLLGGRLGRCERGVELVRISLPGRHRSTEGAGGPLLRGLLRAGLSFSAVEQESKLGATAGRDGEHVVERGLGTDAVGVDGRQRRDDVIVDPVLRERRDGAPSRRRGGVRLVLAEQRRGGRPVGAGSRLQPVTRERMVRDEQAAAVPLDPRTRRRSAPRPRVAEPQRRQHVERRLVSDRGS